MSEKKLKFILIGAGQRGQTYTQFACVNHGYELVAVAEPNANRRDYTRDTYNVTEKQCYRSYKDCFAMGKIADFAIISTQDQMHYEPVMEAIELGYDVLLEKPAAPTPQQCLDIYKAATEKGVKVLICHVLLYTPFFRTVKDILDSGKIGKIMSVIHTEGVGHIHQSHSYVRGNWHNSKTSSNMLLAKSCHDIDIIQWLLGDECKKIQSFGRLSFFTKENCPSDAPERCIDGCPHAETCPYDAVKVYLRDGSMHKRTAATEKINPTNEEVEKALPNTTYGKCVFRCDNDVVDHQTVNMEFENGETVVFTMAAFNAGGRSIRIMGTKGELISSDMDTIELTVFCDDDAQSEHYGKMHKQIIKTSVSGIDQEITGGHGGGDAGIIDDLCLYFGDNVKTKSISDIRTSILNHILVFAAEESRTSDTVVNIDDYMKELRR